MMPSKPQSYMGKSPILKGIGKLYGGLWCLFSDGSIGPRNELARNAVSRLASRKSVGQHRAASCGAAIGTVPGRRCG
jgi:hypothetical protein